MKKRTIVRSVMLSAGFFAVVAILCSQSLFSESQRQQPATEQSGDQTPSIVLNAPGDMLHGSATEVDHTSSLPLISLIITGEEPRELAAIIAEKLSTFLKVLFRSIIAPNAP